MSTGNKFLIAVLCLIPVVVALDAPYWYYAWFVQLACVAAQIGFDVRDARRRRAEMRQMEQELRAKYGI